MRSVRYAQSMAEKPTAAQAREAAERMRQHLIAVCGRAGYPVRTFRDITVRRVGGTMKATKWVVSVTAEIEHVC